MVQVLREFNHVNPQDDEEGKEFSDTRVCALISSDLLICSLSPKEFYHPTTSLSLAPVGR